jgi:hypothetical protein
MRAREPSPDELRYLAGRSLHRWAEELASRLSSDDAARLMLGAALATMLDAWGPDAATAALRELADSVDAGDGGFHVGRA